LDDAWRDVVEVSLFASGELHLTGWETTGDEVALPVETGQWYRLRYAISDMDDPGLDDDVVESYSVELWPEGKSPGAIITEKTKMGRHWHKDRMLDLLRWDIRQRPIEVMERERVAEFANRAFDAFPDLLTSVLANDEGARRLADTAVMVNPIDLAEIRRLIKAGREAQAASAEAAKSRIAAQLVEVARAREQA
jgi:hypothetical protein